MGKGFEGNGSMGSVVGVNGGNKLWTTWMIWWYLQCMVRLVWVSGRMWCAIVIWVTLHVVESLLGVKNFHENKDALTGQSSRRPGHKVVQVR